MKIKILIQEIKIKTFLNYLPVVRTWRTVIKNGKKIKISKLLNTLTSRVIRVLLAFVECNSLDEIVEDVTPINGLLSKTIPSLKYVNFV